MVCEQCGTETVPGHKFCGECGTRVSVVCDACGTANPSTHRFCSECGAGLTERGDVGSAAPPGAPAGSTDAVADERRVVTVLFADLVAFTTYAESRDPEEVRGFLTRYFDAAREVIERFGGTVEKFIGDAVVGVWGVPLAREDDPERAVRAGIELVDAVGKLGADEGLPDLDLRAGVLTGEAAVGSGHDGQVHVVGDIVNTASRLQSVAAPGAVLVGEPTYRACDRAIAFEPLGEQELKGKTLGAPAWRALHVRGLRGGERRTEALEPPFVGRDEELRLLKDQLHAAGREGRSRLVSITGIVGIGKSRLVWELQKYIDGLVEPVYWHEGRSPAYGEGVALWALAEMVRHRARIAETDDHDTSAAKLREMLESHVPDEEERRELESRLAGLLGLRDVPSGARGELFSAFRRLFERIAERGTTVLVFEDLHWADAAMLDFVEELPEWSRDRPILVIALARPELVERRPTWGAARRNVIAAHLGPLSDEAMAALITGLVPGLPEGAVELIADRAAGVPLYAVELVRTLLLDERLVADAGGAYRLVGDLAQLAVPETLHAAVAARLDRLDTRDRQLIQDAAVLGQSFTVDVLAALTGDDVDELTRRLSELVRRELLTFDVDPRSPERGQYGFLQSLIREVAYTRLARADRRARHLTVARHFEAAGDAELAGIVADHYLQALAAIPDEPDPELRERTLAALREASDRASALHSHEQVLAYCERAIELVAGTDEEPDWWERAARSAHALARQDVAEAYAQRLVDRHTERGDRREIMRAQQLLALVLLESHQPDRALELLEAAVADLDESDGEIADAPDATALVAQLARVHMLSGDLAEAATVAERALVAAEGQELLPVIADALITRGTALGDLGRLREGTALLREALLIARTEGLAHSEMRASGNLSYLLGFDELRTSHNTADAAYEQAHRLGERGWMHFFGHNLLGTLFHLGRWDDVLLLAEEFEDSELPERERAAFRTQKAVLLSLRGEAEEAQALLESARPVWDGDTDPQAQRNRQVQEAFVRWGAGDTDAAWDLAMEAMRSDPYGHPGVHLAAALFALASGSVERIADVCGAIDALPRRPRSITGLRRALAAALALLDGDVDGADLELARARERLDGFPLVRSLVLSALGRLAEGRHPEAAALHREGRELLDRVGASPSL